MTGRQFAILFLPLLATNATIRAQAWQLQETPTHQNLARLDMVRPDLGWAVSYDGLILKYDGQIWSISDSLKNINGLTGMSPDSITQGMLAPGDIYTIRMSGAESGWIAVNEIESRSYGILEYTEGVWRVFSNAMAVKLRGFDFNSSGYGIAVGDGGGYEFLPEGWQLLQLPVSLDFRATKVLDSGTIFIAGTEGVVLRKKEAKDWQVLYAPERVRLRDLDFISDDEGWLVGDNGCIFHYRNEQILKVDSPTHLKLWAIDMISKDSGFAVGKDGIILRFEQGNWSEHPSPTRSDLHDIAMTSRDAGWIVGASGTFLKYGPETPEGTPVVEQHEFLFRDQVYFESSNLMDRIDDVRGIAASDFDGDGQTDFYLTCTLSLNHLLLNKGGGYYVDYVIESRTGGNIETRLGTSKREAGALAADFDRDGDSDLLLAGKSATTRLFSNNGKAIFDDVTARAGLPENISPIAGAIADFDLNGYPDFVLADEFRGIRIFENNRYFRFKELRVDSLGIPNTGIRALVAADFDHDDRTDMFVFYHQIAPVLLSNKASSGWTAITGIVNGPPPSSFVNSASAGDFNGDGFLDIYLCTENGDDAMILYEPEANAYENRTISWNIEREGRSYSAAPGDYDHDGNLDLYVSRFGNDLLYLNQNNRRFIESGDVQVYSKSGYLNGFNTGTGIADIDDDGDLDLLVGNSGRWSSLLQNSTNDSGSIVVRLQGATDTREALGAKVWFRAPDDPKKLIAYREVNPGMGDFCQSWPAVHAGLGTHGTADIEIRFPNGDRFYRKHVRRGSRITLLQGSFLSRHILDSARWLAQFIHQPRVPNELLKFAVFMAIVLVSARLLEKRYHWKPSLLVLYALLLVVFYALLASGIERNDNILHDSYPFITILSVVIVLVIVSEQIRKNSFQQDFVQNKLRETTSQLTKTIAVDRAIRLTEETLGIVLPNCFTAFYTYHPDGNYFLSKTNIPGSPNGSNQKIVVEREELKSLLNREDLVPANHFPAFLPDHPDALDFYLSPLALENGILGMAVVGVENQTNSELEHVAGSIKYLLLQLSLTINNIRMLRELKDQENLAAIGTFSGGIVHNLKNPVDGLRMMIEMLHHETNPEDPKYEYICELNEGVQKLKRLLLQSFDFLNFDNEVFEFLELSALIQEVAVLFKGRGYRNLKLDLDDRIPLTRGNRTQIKLALENLIQNGLDATAPDTDVLVSSCYKDNTRTAEINVTDHGSGIAFEDLDKIFDLFYSTRGKSRGIGLTITRNIVKGHRGHINVRSEPGKETVFSVILPIQTSTAYD